MAKTYSQVQEQIAGLQREAEALRKKEVAGVVDRIKGAIQHYGLTAEDLFGEGTSQRSAGDKFTKRGKKSLKGKSVPIKYRDEDGNTWTSRGSQPRWLVAALASGRKIEDFLVKP